MTQLPDSYSELITTTTENGNYKILGSIGEHPDGTVELFLADENGRGTSRRMSKADLEALALRLTIYVQGST